MRIADNLACHCAYYRGHAEVDRARGVDVRMSRVKTAKKFTRVAFACVAGDQPMKHPAFQQPNSILEKLREFHHVHHGFEGTRILYPTSFGSGEGKSSETNVKGNAT